jgi:predicted glycosyltransferase
MKKEMKFNHDADSLVDALGIEQDTFALQLAGVVAIHHAMGDEKVSKLSQLITNCVDYNIILLLATKQLMDFVENFDAENGMLNNFSNN